MAREVHPSRRAGSRATEELPAGGLPEDRPAVVIEQGGWARRSFWIVATLFMIVLLMLGVGTIGAWPGWLPSLSNPFQEETTDRSGPVLLESIQDMSRYTAVSGNFEVVIDVERNRRFIPDIVFGERTLFVAAGSVDGYVEFGALAEDALVVDEENNSVEITLPAPELARPHIDHERSYVFAQRRGAINRIGDLFGNDPDRMQQILHLAEVRIGEAADQSGLRERAETNTRLMLTGMITSLGFQTVTVSFVSP